MDTDLFGQLIVRLGNLSRERQVDVIRTTNDRLRDTGDKAPGPDDVPMSALARRIYLLALMRGRDAKRAQSKNSGVPAAKYEEIQGEIDDLIQELGVAGFDSLAEKGRLVELFSTHKVATHGSGAQGFYVAAALYVWRDKGFG